MARPKTKQTNTNKAVSEQTSLKRKADKILTKSKNVTVLVKPLMFINENDELEEMDIYIVSKLRGIANKMNILKSIKKFYEELENKENLTEFDEAETVLEFYKSNVQKYLSVKTDDKDKLVNFLSKYFEIDEEIDDELDIKKILDVDYEYCILEITDIPLLMRSMLNVFDAENTQ